MYQHGEIPPFTEYLSATREVLNQVGIPIHVMRDGEALEAPGVKVPTKEELETREAKYQVLQLARLFGETPANLTTEIGIKEVVLTAHATGIAGFVLTHRGVLTVDIVHAGERYDVAPHELYHLVDAEYCEPSKTHKDPGYAALNTESTYAGEWPLPADFMANQPPAFEGVKETYYALLTERSKALQKNDAAAYCAAEAKLGEVAGDVEVVSEYSLDNVVEDKAELGRAIFDPNSYSGMLDKKRPTIRKKFLLLLARMFEHHPEVVRDYALRASRPAASAYDC